jgi:hypothetical protein
MAAGVRRLVEHCLSELVVAGVALDSEVSQSPATLSRFPGWLADAGRPAHLASARPELMPERAAFGLILELGSGHQS